MAVRVNEVNQVTQVPDAQKTQAGDGSFKFTLASAITDADLQAKVDALMQDITAQGNRIAEHMDIRDMKRYRGLIKDFLNEVVYRSHKFSDYILQGQSKNYGLWFHIPHTDFPASLGLKYNKFFPGHCGASSSE